MNFMKQNCKECNEEFTITSGNEKYCNRCNARYYAEVEQDEREGRIDYVYAEDYIAPKREE
jgi:uncharacterized Zn ribbon protein